MTYIILFILPIPIVLLINYLIILFRHRKALAEIGFVKQRTRPNDYIITNIKMHYESGGSMKRYISFISKCDICLTDAYMAIMPFQTFPFKAYHRPIIFTKESDRVKRMYQFLQVCTPDKIIFKEAIKSEIEIHYHTYYNKYQVRLKGLTVEERANLEIIRAYC